MGNTARKRIAQLLHDRKLGRQGEAACRVCIQEAGWQVDDWVAVLGIPESDLDGIITGTHKVVPVELNDEMKAVASRIADGPGVSYQEHWDAMLSAVPPSSKGGQP